VSVSGTTKLLGTVTATGNTGFLGTVRVSGATSLESALNVTGAALFSSTVTAVGAATFKSNVSVSGNMGIAGNVSVGGTFFAAGGITYDGDVSVSGDLNVLGNVSVGGTTKLLGTVTATGNSGFLGTVRVSGATSLEAALNVTGAALFSSTVTVAGATHLQSTVSIAGAATFASTVTVVGATHLQSTVSVGGAATFASTVTVVGAGTFKSNVSVSGTTKLLGTVTATGNTGFLGTVRVSGATSLEAALNVTGAALFSSTVTVAGATHLQSTASVGGAATFASTVTVAGNSVLASVDVTGLATAATFEPDGDTAAGDNAAIGYTAAEGLILTGQGSTNDVTIKNDADADVITIATGGTNVAIIGDLTANNFAGRNRIINGAMVIDQRNAGASKSVTPTAFTADRWAAQAATGGAAQQITSTIAGFANSLKYTSSASNAFLQMGQQIEYLNCYDLQNVTVSISFWAKANNTNGGSTALVVRTRTIAAINGAARFSSTAVDTSVTITTSAVKYTVTRTLPATFGALSLEFVLNSHVSGDGFEITGVQLEKSSTAKEFDYRSVGTELALCQRYYYKTVSGAAFNGFSVGSTQSNLSADFVVNHPVELRASPTLTFSALGVIHQYGVGVVALAGATLPYSGGTSVATINVTYLDYLSAQVNVFLIANNNAAAYYAFEAEL